MKSKRPSVAHCEVTFAPSCSTSRLTSRIRAGLFLIVWTPSDVSVVRRMEVGMRASDSGRVPDDAELQPWFENAIGSVPGVGIGAAHMHMGVNDAAGFKGTAPQILHAVELAGARGVAFPFHEPDGYRDAKAHVIAAAAGSNGRLVAFCRVDPN